MSEYAEELQSRTLSSHAAVPLGVLEETDILLGGRLTDMVMTFRSGVKSFLPDAGLSDARVFLPMAEAVRFSSAFAKADRRGKPGDEELAADDARRDGEADLMMTVPLVLGAWSAGKVCVGFDRGVLADVLRDPSWWRVFTTEWVIERLRPWCLWLSLDGLEAWGQAGEGEDECARPGGFFTGLTVTEKGRGLALCCLYVDETGLVAPDAYFEYPLGAGETLGDAFDAWEWDHYAADELLTYARPAGMTAAECRAEMNRVGRSIASKLFPLLAIAIGDEFARFAFEVNPEDLTWTRAPAELPVRETKDEALRRRMDDRRVRLVIMKGRAAESLN